MKFTPRLDPTSDKYTHTSRKHTRRRTPVPIDMKLANSIRKRYVNIDEGDDYDDDDKQHHRRE